MITNDFTPEVPPNDEAMEVEPSSVESIRSSMEENESQLSPVVDHVSADSETTAVEPPNSPNVVEDSDEEVER